MNFNKKANMVNQSALDILGLGETELKEIEELLFNSKLSDDLTDSIIDLSRQIASQKDYREERQLQEKTSYTTYYDRLTGLPNHNSFAQQLQEIISSWTKNKENPFAILVIDLDNFKQINENLGYYFGDRLLVSIAQRVQQCIRSSDLVAHLGGDRFAIILKNISNIEISQKIAYRFQYELSFPFYLIGEEVFTTASIGIALSSKHSAHPDKLLGNAEIALSQAKASGKDSFVVFKSDKKFF